MFGFKSKVTQALLKFLFLHENEDFYVNELARILELDRGNLIKKLKEFEQIGLLQSEFRGHQKYFRLDEKCPLYKEYRSIVRKTFGLESELTNLLKKIKGVQRAWLFGSYARNQMDAFSDVDLLVVGTQSTIGFYEKLSTLQKKLGRHMNAVIMNPKEFDKKTNAKDPFLRDVFNKPTIKIL